MHFLFLEILYNGLSARDGSHFVSSVMDGHEACSKLFNIVPVIGVTGMLLQYFHSFFVFFGVQQTHFLKISKRSEDTGFFCRATFFFPSESLQGCCCSDQTFEV